MHPSLSWRPLTHGFLPDCLCLDGTEIARVCERVDGSGWNSTINMHGPVFGPRPYMRVASRSFARKMAERWATVNLARIQRQIVVKRRQRLGGMPSFSGLPGTALSVDHASQCI